jgi:uncharacterized protein
MIVEITPQTIAQITNPNFAKYAAIYLGIADKFKQAIRAAGIEFDATDDRAGIPARLARLQEKGAIVRNDDKSVYVNRISPACVACQTGLGSATFFISLKCHRNCFFCFNPNQENYAEFLNGQRDCMAELEQIHEQGARLEHIALTGGEPLLLREQTIEFFRFSNDKFPLAYKRLYTSGDQIDEAILAALANVHLDEIRFSIRVLDSEQAQRYTLDRIALAKAFIPNVMVEMPVLPGKLAEMKKILTRLDEIGAFGINLLEFCFPLNNAGEFSERGYRIRNQPHHVLYDYSYAGGLPIAGSESECYDLLEYAIDEKMQLGVHYCSLENKHTGEMYQKHVDQKLPAYMYFSSRDYFLKSAKVFGRDIQKVLPIFEKNGYRDYLRNRDHYFAEFHVSKIELLKDQDIELGISTSVMETRPEGDVLRELKVDLTTPQQFDLTTDV